ncbi:MAG TPA: hypothetical protein VIH90_01045, partial [Candidatus Saccharimonadales bacterium]
MTENKSIETLCAITGLAFHSIGDYSYASDCFCQVHRPENWHYENQGRMINFVFDAVVEKLTRDGYTPNSKVMAKIKYLLFNI